MSKPVFLVGYMGSGKSTTGKKLANRLKYNFIDIDSAIEQMTGMSISEIFKKDGEDNFRQLERSVVVSLCGRKNIVVSTGGGAPCFFDNMDTMNERGITIYLKMHPAALAKRIKESKHERPLLKDVPNDQLPNFIEQHLIKREFFYNQAQLVINGENVKMDDLVSKLHFL